MNCRHCGKELEHIFLDLGFAPPSNAYLTKEDLSKPETYYPLKVMVCDRCWLVQTRDFARVDELFGAEYAYFSSTSTGWLRHAKEYSENMIQRLDLSAESSVIEVASNDGYLLKNFIAAGIPCLGIEPTASTATAAERIGVPVVREFFGEKLAQQLADEGKMADLITCNNVYAHVPDINDFTRGLKALLKPGGTVTLEFPHFKSLLENRQFDTVYHEHFSYLQLYTVARIFKKFGLRVLNVEPLTTHGGSLRVYGCHQNDRRQTTIAVDEMLIEEARCGLQTISTYKNFQAEADRVKNHLILFLIEQKLAGKKVAAYGAAAKGNTLLNYAGIKSDLICFVCDAAVAKQGKFMPGSHIPIVDESRIRREQPDYVMVLPWNLEAEISAQLNYIQKWGGKFVTAVPKLTIK